MKHFGILCPPGAGHLNPMTALGCELQQKGHRVTLFGFPDVKSYATAAKLNFYCQKHCHKRKVFALTGTVLA